VLVYWIVKLFCEALKSEAHAWIHGYGNEAPPPLIVSAAFAGTAPTSADAASAVTPATLPTSALIRRALRTVSPSFDGNICLHSEVIRPM
jgi:hypothetical protein